jgi:Mg2+/citrate symporter
MHIKAIPVILDILIMMIEFHHYHIYQLKQFSTIWKHIIAIFQCNKMKHIICTAILSVILSAPICGNAKYNAVFGTLPMYFRLNVFQNTLQIQFSKKKLW